MNLVTSRISQHSFAHIQPEQRSNQLRYLETGSLIITLTLGDTAAQSPE